MKNESSAAARIAAACEGIIRRCDEVVACADVAGSAFSKMFSRQEIRMTNDINYITRFFSQSFSPFLHRANYS